MRRPKNFEEREYEDLRRNHIGFVFQKAHLIPELTALENVIFVVATHDPVLLDASDDIVALE